MNKIDNRIIKFIKKHHVLTLATSVNGLVHTSNMFYAYLEEQNIFVFTSSSDTKHVKDAINNQNVGINIVLESKIIGNLEGIQICGIMKKPDETIFSTVKNTYLKRFPYAAAIPLELWTVEVVNMKFTDNKLGFGKKIYWTKE